MPLTNLIIKIHKILRSIIWPYNQDSQNPSKLQIKKKPNKKMQKKIQTFQQKQKL
jgi:hypothetical protein